MKKIKLNLDDLKVQSFETTPARAGSAAGTVFGYIASCDNCDETSDPGTACGFNTNGCTSQTLCSNGGASGCC
jgi:hypothetical protein